MRAFFMSKGKEMTEKASLIIEVIEDGVKKATIDLKQLTESAKKAEKSTDDLGRSMSDLDSKAKRAGGALALMSKAAATYLTYEAVKKARDMADTMQNLNTQVQFVTGSYKESIVVQGKLFDIATRTYSSLEATTILYTRTARALKDANKSQADFLKFTEAINNAMRIGGANATEQASALLQLSQALGSGVLQGDEFRSIAENAPILLDLVAKELGVVRGEVKALSAEGKITSEVIFNALTNASGQLEQDASRIAVTAGAALQNLKSKMMQYTGEILNGSGATSSFATVVAFLANNLEFVLAPAIAGATVYAVIRLTRALTALTAAGGPIMIAIGVVSMLASAWNHNSEELERMRSELGKTKEELLSMSMAQAQDYELKMRLVLDDDKKALAKLEEEIKARESRLEDLQKNIDLMDENTKNNLDNPTVRQHKRIIEGLIPLRKEWEELNKQIKSYEQGLIDIAAIQEQIRYRPFERRLHDPDFKYAGENIDLGALEQANKMLDEFRKKSEEARVKTYEQAMTLFTQGEAFKNVDEKLKDFLIQMAAKQDADNKAYDSTEAVTKMLEDLADKADKAGKSMKEIYMIDLTKNGATPEQIEQAMADLDRYITNTPTSGKSSIDHYNDRLQDLSRELSEILSLNKELEQTGYTSQYNAVSQLTLELNDQASTLYKLSEAQKQVLLGQAQQIDSAQQLNAIMSLGSDYSRKFEDMEFELELIGKNKREVDALRFAYELEQQAKLMSIGMSRANIETLEEEIQKIKEYYGLIQKKTEDSENSIGAGIEMGMQRYIDSVGNMRDQFADATESVLGNMEGFLVDFATTGKASFSDLTRSILEDMSRMMIRMAMMQAVTGMQGWFQGLGWFSGGGSVPISPGIPYKLWTGGHVPEYAKGGQVIDFSGGGFTGAGGVYEPKGVVHGGEYVISKRAVNNLGIDYLENLHNSAKKGIRGYSDGGIVGAPPKFPRPASPKSSPQKSGDIIINQTVHYQGDKGEEDGKNAGQDFAKGFKSEVKKILADEKRPGGMLYR